MMIKKKIKKEIVDKYVKLFTCSILVKIEFLENFYKRIIGEFSISYKIDRNKFDLFKINKNKIQWNNITNDIKNELLKNDFSKENWIKLSNENKKKKLLEYNNKYIVNYNDLNNSIKNKINRINWNNMSNLNKKNILNNLLFKNQNNSNKVEIFKNSELQQKLDYLESIRNNILNNINKYPLNSEERDVALREIKNQIINMENKIKSEIKRN